MPGVWGCPTARVSGESRGVLPLWQVVWRVSLQLPLFSSPPFLSGRGPGGWSEHLPPNGACSETKPLCHGFQRVSPCTCKRAVQRGATALAGGLEGVPPASTIFFPPSFQEGGQGDGPNTCRLTERAARRSLFATGSRGCPWKTPELGTANHPRCSPPAAAR